MSISGAPESTSVTTPDDFPAQYDPAATESAIYQRWREAGCFTADAKRSNRIGGDRDPYGILMPPPMRSPPMRFERVASAVKQPASRQR